MFKHKHKVFSVLQCSFPVKHSRFQKSREWNLMVGDGRNEIYMDWVWSFISEARSYETIHETVRMIHRKLSHEEAYFSRKKNERENYDMEIETEHFIKGSDLCDMILWQNRKYMESYYSQHKHVIRRLVLIILSRRWDFTCQGSTAPCRIRITNEKIWFLYWANLNMNCKAEISNSARK